MIKLKLQMQLSIDGFVAGPKGEMDWMTWDWDDEIKNYVTNLTDSVDSILLGRKMTDGFISHWTEVVKKPDDPQYSFARKMVDYPKIVFTHTLDRHGWANTRLANGNLYEEIRQVKEQAGKGIIVYGGASFVSSLIRENLIDEYHLFINPAIIGNGLRIFDSLLERQNLTLVNNKSFSCGITLLNYEPERKE